MKILVLNCFSRNALAAIDSIDPKFDIIGASAPSKFKIFDGFLKNRRLKKILRYTSPQTSEIAFLEELKDIIAKENIELVVPAGTIETDAVSVLKGKIESATKAKCLIEDFSRLEILTDKWQLNELCQKSRVRVPKSFITHSLVQLDDQLRSNEIQVPFIIKPTRSFGSRGLVIVKTDEEFKDFLKTDSTNNPYDEFIIQEFIDGETYDACTLASEGQLIYGLSQCRKMVWGNSGSGVVNITTDDPEIVEFSRILVEKTGYSGISLFEFIKSNKNGKFYLIECNPKIWGTTDLTIKAGLNIVQDAIDILILKKDFNHLLNKKYKVGLMYKYVFPEGLSSIILKKPRRLSTMKKQYKLLSDNHDAKEILYNTKTNSLLSLLAYTANKA